MRLRQSLGFIAIVALVAACGTASPTTPPTAAPTTAPGSMAPESMAPATPALESTTLKVAKAGDHAFDDVSIGYWIQLMKDKYGVTVVYDNTSATDVSLRAAVSGADDMAVAMSLTGLVQLVQQSGTDARLIAADTAASDYFIVSQSSIQTVSDLTGKTEGISAPGDASELVSHLCLNDLGFDYSTLKIVQIGGTSARVAALLAGQIDIGAAHVADANAAVAASNGKLRLFQDCGKVVGNYPVTGMVTTGAWLQSHPNLAQAAVNGYIDAMRWAAANKDAYITFAKTWVPDMDPTQMPAAYDYFKSVGFWPVNGGIDTSEVETYLGYAAQAGVLTGKIPPTTQWVDQTYVNNYLAANGTQ
jgi:ABC-type nitrate/sulfonate/bicarbonate transport system substrate-binding protein